MKWELLIVLVFGLTAQTRADMIVSPSPFMNVDQLRGENTTYLALSPASQIGSGLGMLEEHTIVSVAQFDLSGVTGTISRLELTGSVGNFRHILNNYVYADQYEGLRVGVTLVPFALLKTSRLCSRPSRLARRSAPSGSITATQPPSAPTQCMATPSISCSGRRRSTPRRAVRSLSDSSRIRS